MIPSFGVVADAITLVRVWILALIDIFTSIGKVRVALVALGAAVDVPLINSIMHILAKAVAGCCCGTPPRGPIAVACRVVDPPVQHRGKATEPGI